MNDIKDVQPPVPLPLGHVIRQCLPGFLIALLIIAVIIAVIYFLRRRQTKPAAIIQRLPWEIAEGKLKDLLNRQLIQQGEYKKYFIELSDILRRYIESRFEIHAPHMSTEEFLMSLRHSIQLSDADKSVLREFLNLCDMVKFAKYGPSPEESVKSFDLVKQFVQSTKESCHSREGGNPVA